MYELDDIIVHSLLIMAAGIQLVPIYFAWRVYCLNGYAKYWTEAWKLFIALMVWIGFRRVVVAVSYDPNCVLTWVWVFNNVVAVLVNSALFALYAILKYKFYAYWFDMNKLKTTGGLEIKEERKQNGQ
jgi:hypothetical protein